MTVYAQNALDNTCTWARRGMLTFVPEGNRTIAAWTLRGGADNQSCLFETPGFTSGPAFYAGAWWKFPVGYNHNGNPGYGGRKHRLILATVASPDGKGRLMVNAQGQEGTLRAYVEGFDNDPRGPLLIDTHAPIPLDGQWHHVEVQMDREINGMGRVRLWLDSHQVADATGATGTSPFVSAQVGAYVNQGSDKDKRFYLRDCAFADVRPAAVQQPTPPVTPQPQPTAGQLEAAAQEMETMSAQADALGSSLLGLARRVRGLKP